MSLIERIAFLLDLYRPKLKVLPDQDARFTAGPTPEGLKSARVA